MSAEPAAKRIRLNDKKNTVFAFGTDPDRVLIIDKSIFQVQSEILIEHSEYFRVMFTSGFKERDDKQIEIKELKAEDVGIFMKAVYQPVKFNAQAVDLEMFIRTCVFFQANNYLVTLFNERAQIWLENITAQRILEIALQHGIHELKDAVETVLADNFSSKIKPKRKNVEKASDFKFDEAVIASLKLNSEFGLAKLKDIVDQRVTNDYRKCKHQYLVENSFVGLMRQHELQELKIAIEMYAITLFEKKTNNYKDILIRYFDLSKPVELDQLKDKIEEVLVANVEGHGYSNICREYLSTSTSYKMDRLKKAIEDAILREDMEERGHVYVRWTIIKRFYGFDQPNLDIFGVFPKKNEKQGAISSLSGLLEDAHTHGLMRLKEKLEEFLISEFKLLELKSESRYSAVITDLLELTKFSSKFKDLIQEVTVEHFKTEKNLIHEHAYAFELEQCIEFKLETLQSHIETHLLDEYKKKEDRILKLTDDQITNLAFLYKLDIITAYIQDCYICEFKSDKKNFEKFGKLLTMYEMPLLKTAVEEYFVSRLVEGDADSKYIEQCCDYSYQCAMEQLKEKIDDYLIADLEATRNLKHIKFAFQTYCSGQYVLSENGHISRSSTIRFKKFKDSVTAFLLVSHIDDAAIKAAHEYIFDLPEGAQSTVFKCLFRKE